MFVASGLARDLCVSGCCPGLWWSKRLQPDVWAGTQGQEEENGMSTGGVCGFPGSREDGLAYDGARGYHQEYGLGYGGKRGEAVGVMLGRCGQGGVILPGVQSSDLVSDGMGGFFQGCASGYGNQT